MTDSTDILERVQAQAIVGDVLVTQHAHIEMVDESIRLDGVLETTASEDARILEDYPTHRRGPCCLLGGKTQAGRPLHVVCTTALSELIIITVYEPMPPKWLTPTQRGER